MAAKSTTASPKKTASKKATAKSTKSTAAKSKTNKGKATAKKAASKATSKKASARATIGSAARKPRPSNTKQRSAFLPRAVTCADDDNPLMAHGGGGGGFGRCGGRLISSRLEQQLCDRLSRAGVVHSHSPRHYEISVGENKVAAYAPMIVLRGRGREGKGVVIEAVDDPKATILKKITAFREQYGHEFYVILVADEDSLDDISLTAYDESCSSNSVHTLISRLAE